MPIVIRTIENQTTTYTCKKKNIKKEQLSI